MPFEYEFSLWNLRDSVVGWILHLYNCAQRIEPPLQRSVFADYDSIFWMLLSQALIIDTSCITHNSQQKFWLYLYTDHSRGQGNLHKDFVWHMTKGIESKWSNCRATLMSGLNLSIPTLKTFNKSTITWSSNSILPRISRSVEKILFNQPSPYMSYTVSCFLQSDTSESDKPDLWNL